MDERIRLYVLGLSYSQLQSGAYALVLAEENGRRRIPVVIGAAEAQSIAIALEGIRTPRPMTHELFVSFAHAFGVKMKEVFIYRFEDGVFSSEITFSDGNRTVVIDSRTSDAIAIAMRTRTPIFTTEEILQATGFVIADEDIGEDSENAESVIDDSVESHSDYHAEPRPENFTIEQLEQTLAELIDKEEYEEAERISEILRRKKDDSQSEI